MPKITGVRVDAVNRRRGSLPGIEKATESKLIRRVVKKALGKKGFRWNEATRRAREKEDRVINSYLGIHEQPEESSLSESETEEKVTGMSINSSYFIDARHSVDTRFERRHLESLTQITNIKSLKNYFKKVVYPTGTIGLKDYLKATDSDLFEKLNVIDNMLQRFTNEQIINKPILEDIDLESIDSRILSVEYK